MLLLASIFAGFPNYCLSEFLKVNINEADFIPKLLVKSVYVVSVGPICSSGKYDMFRYLVIVDRQLSLS